MAISDTSGMSLYAKYKYMHYLERKITTKHDTDTYLQRPSIYTHKIAPVSGRTLAISVTSSMSLC